MFRHPAGVSGLGALALGALRAGGRGHTTGSRRGAGAAGAGAEAIGRAACWRRFGPISLGPRSTAKAIARSTHGFGSWTGSERPHARAARHAGARTALPAPRASGSAAKTHDGRVITSGAQRDVGDGRRAGIHARRRVWLDLRSSRTLERGVRGVARVQSREPLRGTRSDCARARHVSMARWTPTPPVGWRFGWITVVSTCQTTSSSRSGIGGSTPASALSRNRKRTVWRSGGIVRSRSKRSTAESFRTSRPSAPPWPTSWSGTTRPGVSEKLLSYHTPIEAREEYELRQAA